MKKHSDSIFVGMAALIIASLISTTPAFSEFRADYDEALALFNGSTNNETKLQAATKKFEELSQRNDAGSYRANTFYWLGECLIKQQKYLMALNAFERALMIPNSNKEEHSRYKVAMCYVSLGWEDSAIWELSRFLRDFPSSGLVSPARRHLNELNSASGKR